MKVSLSAAWEMYRKKVWRACVLTLGKWIKLRLFFCFLFFIFVGFVFVFFGLFVCLLTMVIVQLSWSVNLQLWIKKMGFSI